VEDGDHVKELPTISALSCAVVLSQIRVSAPAFATGYGTVLTMIDSVAEHPPMLAVTWYEVVLLVIAAGPATKGSVNCDAGDQTYLKPSESTRS
jgi:hypothetical protein